MQILSIPLRWMLIILCLIGTSELCAQDTLVLGELEHLTIKQFRDQNRQLIDLASGIEPDRYTPYRVELVVVNPYPIDTIIDLFLPVTKVVYDVKDDDGVLSTHRLGSLQSYRDYASYGGYGPLELSASESRTIELNLEYFSTDPVHELDLQLLPRKIKRETKMEELFKNKYAYTISFLFQGAILFMMLYIFLMYFQNKRKMYLFYALYMLGVALYYYSKIDTFFGFNLLFPFFPEGLFIMNQPVQFFFFIFYSLFIIDFLDLDENDKGLTRQIRLAIGIYIAGIILIPAYLLLTGDYLSIFNSMPYTFGAVSLFSIYAMVRILVTGPDRLTRYIVVGTGFLTVFSLIALLLSFDVIGDNGELWGINIFPINYSQIGTLLEILCFSLGLGYKMRQDHEARKEAQEKVIEYYKENQRLNEEINRDLEDKVQARTQMIERQTLDLEEEKANRLREEYDKKLSVMEMAALKAQMNPHFVFNALNSIKQLVMSGDEDGAVSYLSKFSKLLRNILNNSAESRTSLEDELETCRLYMEIESKRFADNFDYNIHISSDVDTSFVLLPSMLLQPFVENAIWHGLLHKSGPRHLLIDVQKQSNEVVIKISDNGIGREAAKRIRSKQSTKSKSYGMKISSDRIKLYNQLYGGEIKQYIIDKVGNDGSAQGTDVILHIPIDD